MAQIFATTDNTSEEYIEVSVHEPGFDFEQAKKMAKDMAFERCDNPMILSWKNGRSKETWPDYECGVSDTPFWVRYAKGRGANLTVDVNRGEYVFMILKI